MQKVKGILRSPVLIGVLFVAAAALVLVGGINAATAAPSIQSADYQAEVKLTNVETTLTEQGNVREGDDTLLQGFPWDGSKFTVGKTYEEKLGVRNIGNASDGGIPEYVRVSVFKYWVDENGEKVPELDPSLIELNFVTNTGWTIDTKSSTRERTVLYYRTPISTGEDTADFTDKLRISSDVLSATATNAAGETIDYDGKQFVVKAVVDAVQTHSADEAMTSAWGQTNMAAN